jgi:hypothetical protein
MNASLVQRAGIAGLAAALCLLTGLSGQRWRGSTLRLDRDRAPVIVSR